MATTETNGETPPMTGPLTGVRVLDLTNVISGPSATMILGDQGADIIKVEALSGDFARHVATRRGGFSASFLNNNRNKRSIALDLKSKEGMAALCKIAETADVFVQNFRPGVAERLGIGYDDIKAINPKIVYASISGFGFVGPLANRPVYDPLIQALSSLTTVQAGSDSERPKLVRTIVPDKLTGVQASQAIVAGLFSRERTGEGQHIKLSMLDTIISFLWGSDMGGHTFVGDEDGEERSQSFIDLIYETKDGFVTISVMQDKQWHAFCEAMGQQALLTDKRFASAESREINKDARLQSIQDVVINFTQDDVLQRLEKVDVPCAPVLTRTQMRDHEQVKANEIIVESEHEFAGTLRHTRSPATFSQTPTALRFGAPRLGQHTEEILREAGLDDTSIQAILAQVSK